MTSILLLKEIIYCKILRCNYVRNEELFLDFFLLFWNLDSILKIFDVKMTLQDDVFLNLRTPKYVVRSMSKKSCFRKPFHK